MSLTKEERELVEECRSVGIDSSLLSIIDRLVAENDRLSARCEELESSRDVWKNGCLNRKSVAEVEQLQSKFTALIEAAEPFAKLFDDNYDPDMGMCHTWKEDIKGGHLRKLAEAVKEAKG